MTLLAGATQSVKRHFFFTVYFINRCTDWWSRWRIDTAENSWFRVYLHPFMATCGNEARARAPSSTMTEISKTEPRVRTAL